jgi:glycine C-acetyltransferase
MERVIFNPTEQSVSRMINFASNNYLNMTNHPSVIAATIKAAETYGTGSGASCITSGRTKIKSDLEQEIADTFESEDALVYPAGFMANVGVLKALLRSNDVAIVDMLAHASIMDGVENRNKLFFQHNDMVSLEKAMIRANQQYANKIRVVAQ